MFKFLGKNTRFNSTLLHQVTEGQTWADIARQYDINLEVLKHQQGKKLYAGQCIILSDLDKKYHLVQPAETLAILAKRYATTPEKIMEKNKVRQIFVGQLLEI